MIHALLLITQHVVCWWIFHDPTLITRLSQTMIRRHVAPWECCSQLRPAWLLDIFAVILLRLLSSPLVPVDSCSCTSSRTFWPCQKFSEIFCDAFRGPTTFGWIFILPLTPPTFFFLRQFPVEVSFNNGISEVLVTCLDHHSLAVTSTLEDLLNWKHPSNLRLRDPSKQSEYCKWFCSKCESPVFRKRLLRLVCGGWDVPVLYRLELWGKLSRWQPTAESLSRTWIFFDDVSAQNLGVRVQVCISYSCLFWTCKPSAQHVILCILYSWDTAPEDPDTLLMLNETLQTNQFLNPKPTPHNDKTQWTYSKSPRFRMHKVFSANHSKALMPRVGPRVASPRSSPLHCACAQAGAWFGMHEGPCELKLLGKLLVFSNGFHNFSQGTPTRNIRQQ